MVCTFSKEQLRAFIQENNLVTAQDAQEAVKTLFGQLIQEMLETVLDHELGYSRYNYRNKKTITRETGIQRKDRLLLLKISRTFIKR
ncbi:hypothetical protein TcarDRAFT_1953 [Thermosinus carboxydivorans Nor1]|uniref:Transposase, Mutator family n=1 Tax=Thermosinus carboxydivorans Nor1 TaxID=401526 RepID=A1HPH6_9FIRM|nr:hypothetical protein [Thermosinus carboxydivorans]EAX48075.1 hypothetical protein TcarDRAFT_1953 [Thermosinus carboxydivorans Nor1]